MKCRHCGQELEHTFVDLGFSPPSNAYLSRDDLQRPEKYYPLQVMVCHECWLAQTVDYTDADELFTADYAYFSSTSTSWLAHAKKYCDDMIAQLKLDKNSFVVEVASNDGYLLKNFVQTGIPCLGIEPTHSTAVAAQALGVPVLEEFFGQKLAQQLVVQGKKADLILGNNVYAHVPDINDFTRGIEVLLKPDGVVTIEFPHLMELLQHNQFDTIYHEHFSYLSLHTVNKIFTASGLRIFHVEQLPTHGGSLRVYGCRESAIHSQTETVSCLLGLEQQAGMQTLAPYTGFQQKVDVIKNELLIFLINQRQQGKKVAAYGAAAKGNTLLNYAGVRSDLLAYVCDAAPSKQGKYMPGSHLPIFPPEKLRSEQLDYLLILPWNLAQEVKEQLRDLKNQGVIFMTAVPQLRTL
jgi:SAM-dependent methyltransferase